VRVDNAKEQTLEEQRRHFQHDTHNHVTDKMPTPIEIDLRHFTPIQTALANKATGFEWRRETGDIHSYQHNQSIGWLHIDPQGQFYDRHTQPITREAALEHASHIPSHSLGENAQAQSVGNSNIDHGFSL
jgi:hypothetical protein